MKYHVKAAAFLAYATALGGLALTAGPALGSPLNTAEVLPIIEIVDQEAQAGQSSFDRLKAHKEARNNGLGGGGLAANAVVNPNGTAHQTVYLDFDSQTAPTFQVGLQKLDGSTTVYTTPGGQSDFSTHIYSQAERDQIQARLEADYAPYNVSFTQAKPQGDYSTLEFNNTMMDGASPNITLIERDNDNDGTPDGLGISILFGLADGIDFRNVVANDVARVDANVWTFLRQAGFNFSGLSGLPNTAAGELEAILNQSSNTGAHELGHNVGLRHYDALGPIGKGNTGAGNTAGVNYTPEFPGPSDANETFGHVMASGASTGLPIQNSTTADRFFGERSAVKMAFNEQGALQQEGDLSAPIAPTHVVLPDLYGVGDDDGLVDEIKTLTLTHLDVAPTQPIGLHAKGIAGGGINFAAAAVRGSLDAPIIDNQGHVTLPMDVYQITGEKGDIFSFELMSTVIADVREAGFAPFVSQIALFDENFNVLPYFNALATNICEGESCDSHIYDFTLGYSGNFFVGVWSPMNILLLVGYDFTDTFGDYELFVYRMHVPEPAPFALMAFGLVALAASRRRRAA